MGRWKRFLPCLTVFEWIEVLAVTSFTIYFDATDTVHTMKYLVVSSLAAICGIFSVVLCAAGKKAQYYWGCVNVLAYTIVAWLCRYYGEVMLNMFYYLPLQFVGLYLWTINYDTDSGKVKTKEMKFSSLVLSILLSLASIWLYHLFLARLGGKETWLDSASTIFSIVANALMVLRFREQWILWIIVDTFTVVMWVMAGEWIMTTMWTVYLINSCNGLYTWTKMSKTSGISHS